MTRDYAACLKNIVNLLVAQAYKMNSCSFTCIHIWICRSFKHYTM